MDRHYTPARYTSASTAEHPPFYTALTPGRGSPEPAGAYPTSDASPRRAAHIRLPDEAYGNTGYYNSGSQNTYHQVPAGYISTGYVATSTDVLVSAATQRLQSASFTLPCSMCGSRTPGQCFVVCAVTGEENSNCAHVRALALEREREMASASGRDPDYSTTSNSNTTSYDERHLTAPSEPRRRSGSSREYYARR